MSHPLIEPLEARIAPATLAILTPAHLPEGDSGTQDLVFTVALTGPITSDVTVSFATADGTATTFDSDYTAKSGTLTFQPGGDTEQLIRVPIRGDLKDELAEMFTVTLSAPTGDAMLDAAATTATGTIANDDVRVRVSDVSIVEGSTGDVTLDFSVKLSTASDHEVTVNFETQDGTAISTGADSDFDGLTNGTLTFAPGQTSMPVSVTVHGDLAGELDENFLLKLTGATDATISRATATGTIMNDDASLRIEVADVMPVLEGAAGTTTQMTFRVTLDHGPAVGDVTVDVTTMDGAATLANDYGQFATTLTFAPGDLTKTFTVMVNGDNSVEANEDFEVVLSNASANATIADNTATGIIYNDDGSVFTINNVTVTEGDSGTMEATFTLSRIAGSALATNITLKTVNGTATSEGANPDFTAVMDSFNVGAQFTTRTITVPIRGDLAKEGTETFNLMLSSTTAGVTFVQSTGIATILDNDPVPAVSITDAAITEGDGGTSYLIFEATLSQLSNDFVTVSFATQNAMGAQHPATPNEDYTAINDGTITFEPGQTKTAVKIPIPGDTTDEFDETFAVALSNPVGATLGMATATGTIRNDEVRLTISEVNATQAEGNNGTITYEFQVSLNQAPVGHPVTVNFTTQNDTASTAGARPDYVAQSGTLTFLEGSNAPQTISITVNGDVLVEGDERFFVNLFQPVNATIASGQAIGTILNDDTLIPNATVRIVGDIQVLEGGTGSTTQAVFTVVLENGPATGDVIVDFTTIDGDATLAGQDYGLPATTTLTFLPGQTSKTISVPVKGDTDPEANETFQVQLTASNATIAQSTGTATILNDDGAVFTINDVTITEGDNGTVNAVFLVRLLSSPTSPPSFSVDVTTETGTASSGDFTAVTQTLTFAPGQTQKAVSVPIVGDLIKESAETFIVRLSNAKDATTPAPENPVPVTVAKAEGIGTILDNNDPAPFVSIGNTTRAEGNSGPSTMDFTVTLSHPSGSPVNISYSTQGGTSAHPATVDSDYTQVTNGMVTIEAGQTTGTISIPIIADMVDEFDEDFSVRLLSAIGATIGTEIGTGTIQNDEITLSISDAVPMLEGNNGTTTFTFQVSLNQAPIGHPVMVNFATEDDTAHANVDYVAQGGTLIFPAGDNTPQTVTITVNGDLRDEVDEEFLVKLFLPTNATVIDDTAIGTITNDDTPKISILDAQITEGDSGTSEMSFIVQLDASSDKEVTVKVNTAPVTATVGSTGDYLDIPAAEQTVMLAPGETMKMVKVRIVGDTGDEPTETFLVNLTEPTNATLERATAIGTILDNDVRTLSISNASVSEGDTGTKFLTFTVSLSQPSQQTVTVDYSTEDISAVAGQDYQATRGTLEIEPNLSSKTIMIPIMSDTTVEGNETFVLKLFNATKANLAANTQAVGTIVDDEGAVRLELISSEVDEEVGTGFVQFKVIRDHTLDLTQAVTVQYRTVDGTATSTGPRPDFTAKTGTVTFAAESSADVTITIPITADSHYEFNETFQVELFNPINAAVIDQNGNKNVITAETVTILNNEEVPTLSISNPVLVEGDSGMQDLIFKVRLSAVNETVNEVKVTYDTVDGTANSVAGGSISQDYGPQGPAELKIPKGSLEGTITVRVNGDTRDELDEEFFQVVLSAPVGAQLPGGTVGIGTIVDNDAAPTLQVVNASVAETDSGERIATVMVQLSAVSERPVSVKVTTHDETAISTGSRADFTALDHEEFIYTPGDPTRQINVTFPLLGDTVDEADETFTVTLSNPQFAEIQKATGTVTITDNDPSPAILVNDVSVQEGDDGTTDLIFTVSLSAASDLTVKVDFETMDGTANSIGALADYVAKDGTLKFLPGETSQEVRVKVNSDLFKESDETLSLKLSEAVNGTILTESGTGTILTDGDSAVGIAISNGFLAEGNLGGALNFTVELSAPLTTATTFRVVTTNGTAVSGRDFTGINGTEFTIPANSKSIPVPVTVIGDGAFEATESFFASLRGVPDGIIVVDGKGRGTIFNDDARRVDSHTLQFVDVDGDLVTVRVSEGRLRLSDLTFGPMVAQTGGHQLQAINLVDASGQFQNSDVSVNAGRQKGFHGDAQGRMGDGHVNVGFLRAAVAQRDILQVTNGVDLGTVQIDGDLGKIDAGDTFVTPAIQSLVLRSFGRLGTQTQGTSFGTPTTESLVLGRVENLFIAGSMAGRLDVVGDLYGSIRNLHIGGALLGGDNSGSGLIQFTGKLRNAYIGSITGGDGQLSGVVLASLGADSSIGKLRVGGLVTGGAGQNSGSILAPVISSLTINGVVGGAGVESGRVFGIGIENLVVTGNVHGGTGNESGQIEANSYLNNLKIRGRLRGNDGIGSGTVISGRGIDHVSILGGIFGGAGSGSGRMLALGAIDLAEIGGVFGAGGERSGTIQTGRGLQVLNVFGNIEGGTGTGSGGIEVGGLLRKGVIDGDILGGNANVGSSLVRSGYVIAHRIQKLSVDGDLKAGLNEGTGLALSGTIRAETTIGFLRIQGDVLGNETTTVTIAAAGKGNNQAAIENLKIDGFARFAEILAGYGAPATTTSERGEAVNADARIGKVKFGGDVENISIIAGGAAGADGLFGTADDAVLAGRDGANAKSRIAEILIEGEARMGTTSAGIIAQFVKSLRVNKSNVQLNSGAGNDLNRGREIAEDSEIHVFELPLPS